MRKLLLELSINRFVGDYTPTSFGHSLRRYVINKLCAVVRDKVARYEMLGRKLNADLAKKI